MRKINFVLFPVFAFIACSSASMPVANAENKDNGAVGELPSEPEKPFVPEGSLIADGKDELTYQLILDCGYNYETPDNSGEHAGSPWRHIRQSYDADLQKYVFDFWLHVENDDDRGKPNITDRQRNEIKTDAKSPASMVAQKGESLRMTWKFKLPEGIQTTTAFSHIHQIKGMDNNEGTADVSMPALTFTIRSTTSGKQQFQVIFNGPSGSGVSNLYLAKCALDDFIGEWVEVEETVKFDENGTYQLKIKRVSDGGTLLEVSREGLDFWREGTSGMRPKWGLYRNFGKNGANKYLLRDECLKFADFCVGKLD